jgi:hypothetical protein
MGIAKYLPSAFAVTSVVLAQNGGCSAPTTTLVTGGDVSALAGCPTFSGNVVIQTGAVVSNTITLDGIKEIDGQLTYENDANLQTFSATTLQKITGDFTLSNLTGLSTIDLGSLTSAGNIKFTGLGSLGALGFGNPGISSAGNVTIDNTQITSLTGIANASKLAGIDITNNNLLNQISLSAESIDTILVGPNDVSSTNGVSFDAPNLTSAGTVIIRNCSSVSFPVLQDASDILALIGNTFESFLAPNLTWVGGLVVDDNTALNNMSFPALTAVNGSNSTLDISNNTKLMAIGGFGALVTVNGGVNLAGNFSSAKFPVIRKIGGALSVDTASSGFNCDNLPSTGSNIVRGKVTCKKGDSNPNESGTQGGSNSAASSSSAAEPLDIPSTFMPIFPLIAGLLFA